VEIPTGASVRTMDRQRPLAQAVGTRAGRIAAEGAAFMAEAAFREQLLADGPEVWLAACEAHARDLLALGITRIGDAAVAPTVERLYQRAAEEGRPPITVHSMPVASTSLLLPRFDGPATGEGPSRAPTGPAKPYVDGGHRCAVCLSAGQAAWVAGALLKNVLGGGGLAVLRAASRSGRPRRLGRDLHLHAGMRFWHQDALVNAVGQGAQRGFQIALHAIGNEAIDLALTALERNERRLTAAPGRPRLEHVIFAESHQPRRIARHRSNSRRTAAGAMLAADQAVDVDLMLRAYTLGSARALGCEHQTGSITPGKQADLVHLSHDPLTHDPAHLADIQINATRIAGNRTSPIL